MFAFYKFVLDGKLFLAKQTITIFTTNDWLYYESENVWLKTLNNIKSLLDGWTILAWKLRIIKNKVPRKKKYTKNRSEESIEDGTMWVSYVGFFNVNQYSPCYIDKTLGSEGMQLSAKKKGGGMDMTQLNITCS